MKNLTEQEHSLTAAAEREDAWDGRENLCFMLIIATSCSQRPAGNDKEKTYESQTKTPSPAALNVSVSLKRCSCQVSQQEASGSTTLLSSFTKCNIGTRRVLHTTVVLSVVRPCLNGILNA